MYLSGPLFQREKGIYRTSCRSIEAIYAGILNDFGSGSNVDVCVIIKVHKDTCYDVIYYLLLDLLSQACSIIMFINNTQYF